MDNTLAQILGTAGLPEELVGQLQEAFDQKVAEAQEQAERSVREEMARRYEHDKSALVEAMDRMITDAIQKHEEEKVTEMRKLSEARSKFRQATKEARANYKAKLRENINLVRKFSTEQLTKEIAEMRAEKAALVAERVRVGESLQAEKKAMAKTLAERVKKIDEFVVKQVNKELTEFAQDHKALVETRVKLVAESRQKLKETQKRFIQESAKKVEGAVNGLLKTEMAQLHEDLERNRQNMFGRRIFEAVAAEFMTSYLAEGTEIRKLQKVVESKQNELKSVAAKAEEALKEADAAKRKAKLAEERAMRATTMSELLSNLRGDKRNVMEGMLETIKTENLRESFNRFLPIVLNENSGRKVTNAAPAKKVLAEAPAEKRTVNVTGDQRQNRLLETAQAEESDVDNTEIAQVVRLAGIQK